MKTLISRIIFICLMQSYAGTLLAHVELDSPLGGETFIVGQTVTIEWHIAIPHNTLNWDVLFSSDGGDTWAFIQMDLPPGSLSYSWVVPNNITSQARVSVIQDNSAQDYQDESMNFTIQPPPMLPSIVLGAIDTMIESNIVQHDAIQTWLDNHGGASAIGFCGELIWSHNYIDLSNECGATGSALVTFTVVDECGSTETTATVTVIDSSPPFIYSPSLDLTLECNGIDNLTILNSWLSGQGSGLAQDAGGNVTWSNDYAMLNDSCGSSGNATVIFTATDECGNYSTNWALFTIEDLVPPMIYLAAQDTLIECGLANTQAVLQNWLLRKGGAQASDICGNIVWTNDFPVVVDTCHGSTNVSVNFTAIDECGNSSITPANVTLMGTSGAITLDHADFIFTVSPNPADDILKIEFDKEVNLPEHLTLFDVLGNQVSLYWDMAKVIHIPVDGFAPGMYYILVKTSHGVYTRKVIIE